MENNLRITKISSEDLTPAVISDIEEFMNDGFKTEKLYRKFDPVRFKNMATSLLKSGQFAIFLLCATNDHVEGIIGGSVCPDILTNHIFGSEIVWRVSPRGRGWGMKLLDTFEVWAQSMGATHVAIHGRFDPEDGQRVAEKGKRAGYVCSDFTMVKGV